MGWGFPLATENVAPGYFHSKVEEIPGRLIPWLLVAFPRQLGNLSDSLACGNQTYLSLIRGTPGNTCDFTKVSLENNGWGCRVGHLPDISIIITGSTKKVHVIGAKS